jgi:hypothetical protein
MSEQSKNEPQPPLYAFRLEDLRTWHVVTAWCLPCDRRVILSHESIWRGRPRYTGLVDLEQKLRCTVCGARGVHSIGIARAGK